jgi:sugar/nucleoside kinase (ribokinase family)
VDTNWDPAQRWADPRLAEAFGHASLLLPNEAEALHLAGAPDLEQAVATLTAAGPALVVKLGERGALCAEGTRRYLAEPPPVTVSDTTGAGDCFNAGVIAGLLGGLDLPAATALGCAAGAASTRAPGGTAGAPSLATAQALARGVTVREVYSALSRGRPAPHVRASSR